MDKQLFILIFRILYNVAYVIITLNMLYQYLFNDIQPDNFTVLLIILMTVNYHHPKGKWLILSHLWSHSIVKSYSLVLDYLYPLDNHSVVS